MRKSNLGILFVIGVLVASLFSCKPSIPSDIISESDMENILYDYHIATTLAAQNNSYNRDKFYADILKKYDVTQAEFDSSMIYYTRHYRYLESMYAHIEQRLEKQALAMGGSVQDLNSMGEGFSSTDTTNVWAEASSILFLKYPPYNVHQFEVKLDTAFKPGDKYLLSFDTEFLSQGGRRDFIALLAMRLANDSVVCSSQHFSSPMHASMIIDDTERQGIKELYGLFTFTTDPTDILPAANLVLARNIKLVRMHTPDPEAKQDSISNDSTKNNNINNGIQKTPLDSTSRTTNDSAGRKGAILSEEGMPRPKPIPNQNIRRN